MQPSDGERGESGRLLIRRRCHRQSAWALTAIGVGGMPTHSVTDILSSVKAPWSVAPSQAANPLGRVRRFVSYFMMAFLRRFLVRAMLVAGFPHLCLLQLLATHQVAHGLASSNEGVRQLSRGCMGGGLASPDPGYGLGASRWSRLVV